MEINEWMDELLMKINKDDETTSQICAYMFGLIKCPWGKVKSISLSWETYRIEKDYYHDVLKPRIRIEFK